MFVLASKNLFGKRLLVVNDFNDSASELAAWADQFGVKIERNVSSVCEAISLLDEIKADGIMLHTRHAEITEAKVLQLWPAPAG